MKNWFESFESALRNDEVSEDLIGAGKASAELAMNHYRFQHQAKVREAIEDTFPVLLRHLGESWNEIWNSFWRQNEVSPRSLDFFPEVFLNYFTHSDASLHFKELARFEHDLDIFSWTHGRLDPVAHSQLQENSRMEIGSCNLKSYQAPVTELYDEGPMVNSETEKVLIWMKGDSVFFRKMKDWEIEVLQTLSEGIVTALEFAPDDSEEVSRFFNWLGSSHLIRKVY